MDPSPRSDDRVETGKGTSSTRADSALFEKLGFSRCGPRGQFDSRKRGAVTIFASIDDEFSFHWISVNVVLVIRRARELHRTQASGAGGRARA